MKAALKLLSAVGLAALVACGPSADGGASAVGGAVVVGTAAAVDLSLPPNAPDAFGFGSGASAARIALWDIDVKPDGEGLPPGSGSVAQGEAVYQTMCVACHGPTGTEGPNDRLVGTEAWEEWPASRTLGNYWPYATTLFDYINKAMPQTTPGVLTHDETYAVIAYLLFLNEIVPEGQVLDAESLAAVEMPARDRFVVDDRVGGSGPIR